MKTNIIIKDLKKGDKLYSTIHGIVEFDKIIEGSSVYAIRTLDKNEYPCTFTSEGKWHDGHINPCLFKTNPFKEVERVVLVKDKDSDLPRKRVLMTIKDGRAICWAVAETIKDVNPINGATFWNMWKEIGEVETPKIIELTFQDISNGKGVGVDPKLIKIIL